ncbi:TPA: hypothetical protein ACGO3D_000253 [Streptococcus suis]
MIISSTVGINIVTVGTILKDFIKQDILLTKDKISQGKGRPTTQYQLNPNYFHFLSLILYRKDYQTVQKYFDKEHIHVNDHKGNFSP